MNDNKVNKLSAASEADDLMLRQMTTTDAHALPCVLCTQFLVALQLLPLVVFLIGKINRY